MINNMNSPIPFGTLKMNNIEYSNTEQKDKLASDLKEANISVKDGTQIGSSLFPMSDKQLGNFFNKMDRTSLEANQAALGRYYETPFLTAQADQEPQIANFLKEKGYALDHLA